MLLKLKLICEKELFNNINNNTVFNIIKIADRHNLFQVKQQALNFMSLNARLLIDTQGFNQFFQDSSLFKDIFKSLITSTSNNNNNNNNNYGGGKHVKRRKTHSSWLF